MDSHGPGEEEDISGEIRRHENVALWRLVGLLVTGMLLVGGGLGGVVWNRVAGQVDENTRRLAAQELDIQAIKMDAASDRRAASVDRASIIAWLQAIGQRLNVAQPPPGSP